MFIVKSMLNQSEVYICFSAICKFITLPAKQESENRVAFVAYFVMLNIEAGKLVALPL